MRIEKVVKMMSEMRKTIEPVRCKYCQSKRTRRYGQTQAGQQRWRCNDCRHTFIEDPNILPGMRTPSDQIGAAVSMFYEGLSLNAIRRQLQQIYGSYPSDGTVYEWVAKSKDYQPEVGDVWLCDETVLKVAGQNTWLYDVIDTRTRYLLSSHLADKRYLGDAKVVLVKAGRKAGKKPEVVITDSLPSYPQAIGDVFGADVRHIKFKGITKPPNNNILERFHGTLKARTKIMRGLKSMDTAKLFTDAWMVFYNYMRPHETLGGRTPAEKAGVKYPYDNWAEVVRGYQPSSKTTTGHQPVGREKLPPVQISERKHIRITPPRPRITPKRRRLP